MDRQLSQLPPRGSLAGAVPVRMGYRTDKGRRRSNNEDSYAVFTGDELNPGGDAPGSESAMSALSVLSVGLDAFLVVADGMGGTKGGEIASNIVVNALGEAARAFLASSTEKAGRAGERAESRPFHGEPQEVAALLRHSLLQANSAVWRTKQREAELAQMGTTCVTAILCRGTLTIGNVGDSRAYLLRRGQLRQLTEDHSEVYEQVKAGRMTPQQAASSRFRNTITRAMGLGPEVTPDIDTLPMETGDVVLLCSDGLTTEVDDRTLAHLLAECATPQQAADRLVATALENGGADNVTVLVLHYGNFAPLAPESTSVTSSITSSITSSMTSSMTNSVLEPVVLRETASHQTSPYQTVSRNHTGETNVQVEEDITDPNQAWKRSLQPPGRRTNRDIDGRTDRTNGTASPVRPRPERGRDAQEWEKAEVRSGISPFLFGLVTLVALGEAVVLGMLFAGIMRLPRRVPAPAPQQKTSVETRPTDGPLKYQAPVPVGTPKNLWEGVLQVMPDSRLLVMNSQGEELAITPGGSVIRLLRTGLKPPPSGPGNKANGKPGHTETGGSTGAVRPAVAVDISGNRYELNPKTRAIDKYDPTGVNLVPGIGKGKLKNPANLAVDKNGDLYVIDGHQLMRLHAVPDTGTAISDEKSEEKSDEKPVPTSQ